MVSNKNWNIAKRLPSETLDELKHFPPVIAQLLHNRGINTLPEANAFFHPSSHSLHNPLNLPDMHSAITRIEAALEANELVGIFGDFDADGVTATSVLALGLMDLGIRIFPYIPNRTDEGHGLNLEAIGYLSNQGVSLIITVDCGITSVAEISYAKTMDIDTIVTDHHQPLDELPISMANINPQIGGHSYPFNGLTGVGLAFKLIQGLYENLGLNWNTQLLQLVAIGTITDVGPLLDENRYIVTAGLDSMYRDPLPGLKALLSLSRIKDGDKLDAHAISFSIGPLVNAPGRLGDAMKSYNILTSKTKDQAYILAQEIDQINKKRRDMTQKAMEIVKTNLDGRDENEAITLVWDEQFTPGIVGLIASRLVDQYAKPAIAIAIDGDWARGSARSIRQFNLVAALSQCEDLFIRFGGHPMAAGFTIKTIHLPILKERLSNIALESLKEKELIPTLNIDANVRVSSLTGETFKIIQSMEPFGEANTQPLFITTGVEVKSFQYIGKKKQHLRMRLYHNGSIWDAVAFNQAISWDGSYKTVDIVYTVDIDNWSGKDVFKLYIKDFRVSNN
jgi:single-stranded-DNA-specific exonuclease